MPIFDRRPIGLRPHAGHTPRVRTRWHLRAGVSILAVTCAAVMAGCHGPTDRDAAASSAASLVPAASTSKLIPPRGAYLGFYYGARSMSDTDRSLGTVPKVHLTYFGWSDNWAAAASTRQDLATGRIPLVNWEPFGVKFDDIIAGRYDPMLRARAAAAAAVPHEFFLDFAAEMNEEEGWGGHNPARYIAAWRHIHDVFTRAGADNVVWVWAPNNVDSPGAPTAMKYYPGDAYVDWTGIDGYNWGTSKPGFTWQPFAEVFGAMYDRLHALGKPIIIGETASDEAGGNKAAWIADVVTQLRTRFPDIRALVWFDVDKERHWQIASSPASAAAMRTAARNPYFRQ